MPRIRTLKPEHRQHRKVGPLRDREYRLWVSMILEADDEGRLVCDAAQLRAVTWAYDPTVTVAKVEDALRHLAALRLITLYEAGGLRYAAFPSWGDHQVINKKRNSTLPIPPPVALPEQDGSTTGTVPWEGKGTEGNEGKGVEGRGRGRGGLTPSTPTPPGIEFKVNDDIQAALKHAPTLGAVSRLWSVEFWRAEVRANGELDLPAEILKAEAWIVANPRKAPRKDLVRFFHNWLARADREEE